MQLSQLHEEIAALENEKERTEQRVHKLRASENPDLGVFFAQEIFEAQQEKLRLEVELQFRRNKVNRIKQGIDGMEMAPPLSCLQ